MNFATLMQKAKGDQKSGHKYKSRKPDGKGGWLYDYGSGYEKPKGGDKAPSRYASPEDIQTSYTALKLQPYTGPFTITQSQDGITGQKQFVLTDKDTSILTTGGMFMDSRAMNAHGHKRIMFDTKEKAQKFRFRAHGAAATQLTTEADIDIARATVEGYASTETLEEIYSQGEPSPIKFAQPRVSDPGNYWRKSLTTWGDLIKAKGDQKSGHKYKSRKPDGKGGWVYDYGKKPKAKAEGQLGLFDAPAKKDDSAKEKKKLVERLTKLGSNPKEAKRDVDKHFDDLAPYKDASISKQAEVIAALAAKAEYASILATADEPGYANAHKRAEEGKPNAEYARILAAVDAGEVSIDEVEQAVSETTKVEVGTTINGVHHSGDAVVHFTRTQGGWVDRDGDPVSQETVNANLENWQGLGMDVSFAKPTEQSIHNAGVYNAENEAKVEYADDPTVSIGEPTFDGKKLFDAPPEEEESSPEMDEMQADAQMGFEEQSIFDRIQELEALQTKMKASNKILRSKKLSDEQKIKKLVDEQDHTEKVATDLVTKKDFAGRLGYPSYATTNNNANIRRLKGRLKDVAQESRTETADYGFEGGTVTDSLEDDRLQIYFDSKPDADMRGKLKGSGWKWAPSVGAWQRKRNDNARSSARYVLGDSLSFNKPVEKSLITWSDLVKSRRKPFSELMDKVRGD
jgi:hypothetical protein